MRKFKGNYNENIQKITRKFEKFWDYYEEILEKLWRNFRKTDEILRK